MGILKKEPNPVGRPSKESLKKKRNQKILVGVLVAVALLLVGGGAYLLISGTDLTQLMGNSVTRKIKTCPAGSYVQAGTKGCYSLQANSSNLMSYYGDYKCPKGYKLSGTNCIKTESGIPYVTSNGKCPESTSDDLKNIKETIGGKSYSFNNGKQVIKYTLNSNGKKCEKTIMSVYPAVKTDIKKYTCVDGSKYLYNATKDGNETVSGCFKTVKPEEITLKILKQPYIVLEPSTNTYYLDALGVKSKGNLFYRVDYQTYDRSWFNDSIIKEGSTKIFQTNNKLSLKINPIITKNGEFKKNYPDIKNDFLTIKFRVCIYDAYLKEHCTLYSLNHLYLSSKYDVQRLELSFSS